MGACGTTAVVWFTRDLRVHDQPALAHAAGAFASVLPVFVLDDRILPTAGARGAGLHDALSALRAALRQLGGDLVVRRGDPVRTVVGLARAVDAAAVVFGRDVSGYAKARERRLVAALAAERRDAVGVDAVTVVPPGSLAPAGGDHYKVFTPYWRAWSSAPWQAVADVPASICLPPGVEPGAIPDLRDLGLRAGPAGAPAGGEAAARERMGRFLSFGLAGYESAQADLAGAATSRLSADLHLGCLSARELAAAARAAGDRLAAPAPAVEAYLRQLCWRDFFAQVLRARSDAARVDYRPRRAPWREDDGALEAWRAGRTGVPLVDAALRQLAAEGDVPNRARLVAASFLTRQLGIHWRHGAAYFADLLRDADVASNAGNWQWAAGTGNDPRPNRTLDPTRQARRLDPDGRYVRRHVPELAELAGRLVHEPWRATGRLAYPPPIGRGAG